MKNIIMYKKGEASWIRWIKKRIDNNLNLNALFTGPTGIGKTFAAIEVARLIDPDFDVTKQISFNFSGLMRIINQFNNKTEFNLHKKKYKIVIFDEAQTSTNRRDWQSKVIKYLNFLLSTYRHQNIITLFTSPYEDFLDSAALKLFHVKFECRGWSKKTNKSKISPKIYQYNAQKSKMYEHPLYVIRNNGAVPLRIWSVNLPPKEMTEPYELEKFKFTNALNQKITQELEEMAHEDNVPKINIRNELNPLSMQPELWREVSENGYLDQLSLAKKLGKDIGQVNKNIMSMRKKGWDIRKFKKVKK